jgi:hypothetical protein
MKKLLNFFMNVIYIIFDGFGEVHKTEWIDYDELNVEVITWTF